MRAQALLLRHQPTGNACAVDAWVAAWNAVLADPVFPSAPPDTRAAVLGSARLLFSGVPPGTRRNTQADADLDAAVRDLRDASAPSSRGSARRTASATSGGSRFDDLDVLIDPLGPRSRRPARRSHSACGSGSARRRPMSKRRLRSRGRFGLLVAIVLAVCAPAAGAQGPSPGVATGKTSYTWTDTTLGKAPGEPVEIRNETGKDATAHVLLTMPTLAANPITYAATPFGWRLARAGSWRSTPRREALEGHVRGHAGRVH